MNESRTMNKTEIDSHRMMFHPRRVADWLDGQLVYPVYVEIGPTNRCNHRCVFCALDWLKHGGADLSTESLLQLTDDLAACGVKSIMFAGEGEPFLHDGLPQIIRHAKSRGLDLAVTTNGAVMDEEKSQLCLPSLSWIRISLDAGTPKTYSQIHGVSEKEFSKTIHNIESAVRIKQQRNLDVIIGLQVLILPMNKAELVDIAKMIKSIGADNIQFKPYSHHPASKNNFTVDHSELEDIVSELKSLESDSFQVFYRKNTIERIEKGRDYHECHGLPFFALVDSHGNVIPCNMFYSNPDFAYGNLNQQSFPEIWAGEKRKQVIEKIREMGISVCREGCRLDAVNRYLHQLKNPHPHVNFI